MVNDVLIRRVHVTKTQPVCATSLNPNTVRMSSVFEVLGAAPSAQELWLQERFGRSLQQTQAICYEYTNSPDYLLQYQHVRAQMYARVLGLRHFSGELDAQDAYSHILVARRGNQVLGGARVTIRQTGQLTPLPMEAHGMPLQQLLPELGLAYCSYGEFSRLARLPDLDAKEFTRTVYPYVMQKALECNVQHLFAVATQAQARMYRIVHRYTHLPLTVRDDIAVPEHPIHEGLRMVLMHIAVPTQQQ